MCVVCELEDGIVLVSKSESSMWGRSTVEGSAVAQGVSRLLLIAGSRV